jgi:hypothetical protein
LRSVPRIAHRGFRHCHLESSVRRAQLGEMTLSSFDHSQFTVESSGLSGSEIPSGLADAP